MKRILAALVFAAFSCAGLVDAAFASDLSAYAFHPHPGARLPLAVELFDEQGRRAPLGSFFNKTPVILVLDYLRCRSLCGLTLENIFGALDALPLEAGRDFQLVSISIDPRDTPADAAKAKAIYAALYGRPGGASGMHFLTAPDDRVRKIAAVVGFPYSYDKSLDEYIHPAGFVLATPGGAISSYVEGIDDAPDALARGLADAEQDKSIGPLTRILLFCHIQGAPLGKYTVPVLAAFTLADLVAGFGLVWIFNAIRRQRHV